MTSHRRPRTARPAWRDWTLTILGLFSGSIAIAAFFDTAGDFSDGSQGGRAFTITFFGGICYFLWKAGGSK